MHGRKKIIIYILISIIGLFWLSGCDSPSSDSGNTESKAEAEAQNGLIYKSSMKLLYAKNFSVDYYEGGYKILTTKDGTKILTVPKGRKTPKDIEVAECFMPANIQSPIMSFWCQKTVHLP